MRYLVVLLAALVGAVFTVALGSRLIGWAKWKYYVYDAGETSDTTARAYERLVRAQFTAADPLAAQRPILCEGQRLFFMLGDDSASRLVGRIDRKVLATTDERAQRRVDSALALKLIGGGEACQELARQGVLGGPFPSDSERRAQARQEWEKSHPE